MTRTIKTFLVLMLAMLGCGVATAQTQMTFYEPNGHAIAVWSLQDVGKVTFEGGDIVVTHATGTYSSPLAEVMSIKFTDDEQDPTSVKQILDDASQLRIATSESAVRVIGASRGTVAIWSVSGQQLYDNRGWHGEEIDISHLERGIYIITINNSTFKFKK